MAVEKAQEVMQMRRAGWRSFLEQIKNYAFLFYCFTLSASLIVITWCAFTIVDNNKRLFDVNESIKLEMVYKNKQTAEIIMLKREYEILRNKMEKIQ